ncbi:hypothetical protein Tco_0475576 [Tanacetum coccineum]
MNCGGDILDWEQAAKSQRQTTIGYEYIPSEDPYEEAARQLLEQAPHSPEYVPDPMELEDHVPVATTPSTYHSLLPSGTPPLLPIPLPAPSTSRRADIPEADMPPRKRLLLTTPRPGCESSDFATRHHDAQKDRVAVRAEIDGQLDARVTVLETEVRRHKWQRQAVDDLAVQHIIVHQALAAGITRLTHLEDTVTVSKLCYD